MARKIRYTPEGGALFEITCRTIHSRFLARLAAKAGMSSSWLEARFPA